MTRYMFTEVATILGADYRGIEKEISGMAIDSRQVKNGDLFFALKGEKVDSHIFLKDVAEKGAIGAVVSQSYAGENFGLSLIKVENVLTALQHLAQTILAQRKTKVVAVTGSVGKTTTKEFLAHLLEIKYRVGKSPGNANSQTGVPLSILQAAGDEEILVLEMGISQPGEMERLVKIGPPLIALITKIAPAHIAAFPNGLADIAAAKCAILSHPQTRLGILHNDVKKFPDVLSKLSCKKQFFGRDESDADYRLFFTSGKLSIEEQGEMTRSFMLPFEAQHLQENFLGAAAVARSLGLSWEEIFEQARTLRLYPMRFEKIEKEGVLFINDAYNANPESMRAALRNIPVPKSGGKRVAVLGELAEQGDFSEENHREMGSEALQHVDELFCYGMETRPMVEVFSEAKRSVQFFTDIALMRQALFLQIKQGDVVLLKGKNTNGLWRVLD